MKISHLTVANKVGDWWLQRASSLQWPHHSNDLITPMTSACIPGQWEGRPYLYASLFNYGQTEFYSGQIEDGTKHQRSTWTEGGHWGNRTLPFVSGFAFAHDCCLSRPQEAILECGFSSGLGLHLPLPPEAIFECGFTSRLATIFHCPLKQFLNVTLCLDFSLPSVSTVTVVCGACHLMTQLFPLIKNQPEIWRNRHMDDPVTIETSPKQWYQKD